MARLDELQGGASNPEEYALVFEHHGEQGITRAYSARLADEILADTTAPASDVTPGPRRNRHLDGFGGRQNA